MNLQPIELSWTKARDSLRNYTAILKEKRTAEDIAIIRSTKAILSGKMVIRLADAVRNGGVDGRGLPKVAIARADDKFVKVRSRGNRCDMTGTQTHNEYVDDYDKRGSWQGRKNQANPRAFDFNLTGRFQDRCEATAVVPTIPPQHRPTESALERFYILFEAVWDVKPPVDPALLSPLGGGLFAVVAVWDLTPVEQAVLAQSRGL